MTFAFDLKMCFKVTTHLLPTSTLYRYGLDKNLLNRSDMTVHSDLKPSSRSLHKLWPKAPCGWSLSQIGNYGQGLYLSGMTFTSYLQTWFTLYPKTLCGLTIRKTGLRGDKNMLGLSPSDVRWADGLKKLQDTCM